jgi:hypothetical protein
VGLKYQKPCVVTGDPILDLLMGKPVPAELVLRAVDKIWAEINKMIDELPPLRRGNNR